MLITLNSFFQLFFSFFQHFAILYSSLLLAIFYSLLFFTALYCSLLPVCFRKQQSFSTARARWEMVFLMSVPSCANDWS